MEKEIRELLVNMTFWRNVHTYNQASSFLIERDVDPDEAISKLIQDGYIWRILTPEDEVLLVLTPKGLNYV